MLLTVNTPNADSLLVKNNFNFDAWRRLHNEMGIRSFKQIIMFDKNIHQNKLIDFKYIFHDKGH